MCIYDIKNDCVAWSGKSRDGKTNKQVCIGRTDKWSPICQVIPMHSWEDCLSASNSPWHPFVLWRWERHGVLDAWRLFYMFLQGLIADSCHWCTSFYGSGIRGREPGGRVCQNIFRQAFALLSSRHSRCLAILWGSCRSMRRQKRTYTNDGCLPWG